MEGRLLDLDACSFSLPCTPLFSSLSITCKWAPQLRLLVFSPTRSPVHSLRFVSPSPPPSPHGQWTPRRTYSRLQFVPRPRRMRSPSCQLPTPRDGACVFPFDLQSPLMVLFSRRRIQSASILQQFPLLHRL
jgi:hypothetical protein